jgi:Na+-transporting methylmalonyl-CoA/oxaloacetate decarboxylase gamma subunit
VDSLVESALVSVVGLGVVFTALLLLFILIKLLDYTVLFGNRKKVVDQKYEIQKIEAIDKTMNIVPAVVTPHQDDLLEEIAVLAATMYLAMEPAASIGLRINLPLPASDSILWRVQGRRDLMATQGSFRIGWRR